MCQNRHVFAMSEDPTSESKRGQESRDALPEWLQLVRRHLESLKYGTVQITVHDSEVTEVVRSEKTRLPRQKTSGQGKSQTTGSE